MRVVFMGSPEFAVAPLRALAARHDVCLVVSQPDRPKGRGQSVAMPAVKVAAMELNIPVIQPTKVRTGDFSEALRATGADLAVVVAYGRILPKDALDAFPKGCLNIHASLLPKHRGAAPIQWAVISGDRHTGVSIMQLDEGMDTGPVFLTEEFEIGAEQTSADLFRELSPFGAKLLMECIDGIEKGTLSAKEQDHSLATHARMLKKEDGEVDWNRDSHEVSALIRGVDPWPGARISFDSGTLKMFGAKAVEGSGKPGTILSIEEKRVVVACASNACEIKELQAPGKKRMDAATFVKGRRLLVGSVLSL